MTTRSHRAKGFTLLEILLVIGIVVMLGALVMPGVMARGKQAKIGSTKIQINSIEDALKFFKSDIGRYPTTDEGLAALTDADQLEDDDLVDKWSSKYLTKSGDIKDAWGREFRYVCPGEHNEDEFDLSSDGPDGEEGTDDDIVNWEEDD